MSVPKSERKESALQYFITAYKLQKVITDFLLRDFGIKPKVRSIGYFSKLHNMSEDDKAILINIFTKYKLNLTITELFPEWLIIKLKDNLFNKTILLIDTITAAHVIFPSSQINYNTKLEYQQKAIVICEQLLQTLQICIRLLPTKEIKYMPITELIILEDKLIKSWRDSIIKKFPQFKSSNETGV